MIPITKRPVVRFRAREVELSSGGAFELQLSPQAVEGDVFLVLDVYDLSRQVHPHGHVGWWSFAVSDLGARATGRLVIQDGTPVAVLDGVEAEDRWLNEEPPACEGYAVLAVLRARPSNAIVDGDKVPALADAAAVEAYRAPHRVNRPAEGFALPHFVPQPGSNVRIVSHHIVERDGVGNHAIDLYRMLRDGGVPAALYAWNHDLAANHEVRRKVLLRDEMAPNDQLFYVHSIHDPDLDAMLRLPCARRIAYFQGITDPTLLRVFDPETAAACVKAIAQLPLLEGFDRLAANSRFNAHRLISAFGEETRWHADDVAAIPPKFLAPFEPPVAAVSRAAPQGARLLYVGRAVSHKKIEHLFELMAHYLKIDPAAECWIVGTRGPRAYRDYLEHVEKVELGLPEGAVRWVGSVDEAELDAVYRSAHVYVSMSEDEGFCLPVLEAMMRGLPLFVHGVEAVCEVMGGAGRYFTHKDFASLARELHTMLSDEAGLERIVADQYARASALAAEMNGRAYLDLLAPDPA